MGGTSGLGFRAYRGVPEERKDSNNRGFRAQILESDWYLGPTNLIFGSLDSQG